MSNLLYKCLLGSRLYGTQHSHSDYDYMEVYDSVPSGRPYSPRHRVSGEVDRTIMSLSTFMVYADRGSHQTLEAMFAPDDAVLLDTIRELRYSYRCNTATTVNLYQRTIKNFLYRGGGRKPYPSRELKSQRAAMRMAFHLDEITETGRFNPRLNPTQISLTTKMSSEATVSFVERKMGWKPQL